MLDRAIIDHASPTLARLKLGNLFNYPIGEFFHTEFKNVREQLREEGVTLTVLRVKVALPSAKLSAPTGADSSGQIEDLDFVASQGKALIYVFREKELEQTLHDECIQQFLKSCGYCRFDVADVLQTLKKRLSGANAFPHEIGIFLGYPLEDVLGFIENGGRNCLTCGCWKVYSNECAALTAFKRYEKCKAVYQRLFASGCPLSRLTVAARPA